MQTPIKFYTRKKKTQKQQKKQTKNRQTSGFSSTGKLSSILKYRQMSPTVNRLRNRVDLAAPRATWPVAASSLFFIFFRNTVTKSNGGCDRMLPASQISDSDSLRTHPHPHPPRFPKIVRQPLRIFHFSKSQAHIFLKSLTPRDRGEVGPPPPPPS